MAELRLLHEATVAEEEIDHLGHMNVRFYLDKSLRGTEALVDAHGLAPETCRRLGGSLELRDSYTRHLREQRVGARLAVWGGVLAIRADGLRCYHELVNRESGERAATFVQELALRRRESGAALPLPEMVAKSAGEARVTWPAHARPRTLDLSHAPPALPLRVARERGLAMREPRVVGPEECDGEGRFLASRYLDLVWGGEPSGFRSAVPLFEDGGRRFGWATVESRGILQELPRVGTRIQSFGAEVEITRRTSFRHHWVFDLEREALLCTSSIVNLAFDLETRRAIEIPDSLRETLAARYHPDLR
jgi:acyl-CoA thioester hydrolase